ncbi:translocation/assembly module TamB domain-containing protein [Aquabacterium sp. A7-Y]|uniref:translocation/assembly module TamB domain-containing protein n=1 Tax=Aquabacterium sp. A7-Y TaxID=1349605 RepID=UPI00223CB55B|nr:translocation/assembly module TamB domain-containing protein [Aquabacterium sp. A7-Y]MCW7538804.1 translocation/assembly module TamB domain-containing protein [Aquabacterium sp. A7-Y]
MATSEQRTEASFGADSGPAAPGPPRRRRAWRLGLLGLALLLLALLAALAAGARWIAATESGTRWALTQLAARLPGFVAQEPRGALLGDFSVARLSVPAGGGRIVLDRLHWKQLRLEALHWRAPYVELAADALTLQRLEVRSGPKPPEPKPASPPLTSLRLPVALQLPTLRIGEIVFDAHPVPVTGVQLTGVRLGSDQEIATLAAAWNGLAVSGGLKLQGAAPMQLDAKLVVRSDPAAAKAAPPAPASAAQAAAPLVPAWARDVQVELDAHGPLARFAAALVLRMQDQSLQARAQVTPFEPLPLALLDARFERLDLARLLAPVTPTAPSTLLSGSAAIALSRAPGQDGSRPLGIAIDLANGEPGRWDAKRLPLKQAQIRAHGEGRRWTLTQAELQVASGADTAGGRIIANGRWNDGKADLNARLEALLLDALDGRLAPMRLSGPLDLAVTPPAAATPAPADAASAPAFAEARLQADLTGALAERGRAGAPHALAQQPVQLKLQAQATPRLWRLDALHARSGNTRLSAKGRAEQGSDAGWKVQGDLELQSFNPSLWLPGPPDSAWRRAQHQLNGGAQLQASLPPGAGDAAAVLRQLRGQLDAELKDSVLAGQPLELDLQAKADGAGRIDARSELLAGGNTARLAALLRVPAAGRPAAVDDHLELHLDAPTLQRLAPLAQALNLGPLQGSAKLEARAQGPLGGWVATAAAPRPEANPANGRQNGGKNGAKTPSKPPAGQASSPLPVLPPLSTEGRVQIADLQFGDTALARLQGQWKASTATQAPMSAELLAEQLKLGAALQVPQARLQADGHSGQHRLQLDAELQPGARQQAAAQANVTPAGSTRVPAPLVLVTRISGGLIPGQGAPGGWRGSLEELSLRPTETATGPLAGPDRLPLLVVRNVGIEWQRGPTAQWAQLQPGQAEVLGAVLRWSEARWHQGEGRRELALEAQVDPVAIAPLLLRAQPDYGWAGDLKVGARVSVRAAPELTANVEIARAGGDLQINEYGVVQSLGLSELRLRLEAAGGVWRFSEVVAGNNLGRVAGEQTVRTAPTRWWPEPEADIDGKVEVRVENLSTWGAWVPAGWRLGGQLDGRVHLSGDFGAPDLLGELHGQQLTARNTLQGVALRDGVVNISFQGDSARIETFRFAAGDGSAELSGGARLGEQPQAELRLVASRFGLLNRVDRRATVSGEADVRLNREQLQVTGRFRADEGVVDISQADAPALAEDVVVRRPGDAPVQDGEEPNGKPPATRAMDLDVTVNLGERFRLKGRGIDTRLTGELRFTSPRGRLAAHGEIAAQDGKYEAYGQEMTIERGVFTFVGEIGNPRLDIVAVRPNLDVRVGVTVSGSALAPRVRLFSDPALPPTETLALLITGRSYDTLEGNQTLLLQRAAMALLAGEGGGDEGIMSRIPLDELSVRQTEGAVPETVVTIGKQISERVYVGYERGLSAAAGSWQLIYRIAQRFTLRAQTGDDEAVDLVWLFKWN